MTSCTGSSLRFARAGAIVAAIVAAVAVATGAAAQAPTATENELVFGMCAPFSGTEKEFGRQLRVGWEVAFAAQNETGGVHGKKLRLVAMDDGYDPARTRTAVKELVETKRVLGLVGSFGSATAAVAVPYANEKGVLFFAPYSGANLLRNDPPDRVVFNYRASYREETAAIVGWLVEVQRIAPSQIAVFAQEDAFGDAGFDGVAKVMRRYRRDPAQVIRVGYQRNTSDVDAAVKKIRQHAKDLRAVVMVATSKAAARFVERVRDAGVDLVFTNVSPGANELADELAALGPRYADGVVMTQVVPIPTAQAAAIMKYQEVLKRFAPGEKPEFTSLEAYVSARILIEAMLRAGSPLTLDRTIDALEHLDGLDLGIGVPIRFAPSEHQGSHKVWGTVIDGHGQFKPIDLQ